MNHNWKKHLGSLVVLALIVGLLPLLAAAAPAAGQVPAGPADLVVDAQDGGRQIHLAAGQVLAVRLEANPSTGYLWEVVEVDGQVLQQLGQATFEPESALLGAPGIVTLRFRPVTAGETRLSLAYRRPWEKAAALAEFSLQVATDGASAALTASRAAAAAPLAARPEPVPAGPEVLAVTALPTAFNWCDRGACTPVKNQGNCGSCWAFSTVGLLESWIKLSDGITRDLSEQYLVSCNIEYPKWGCDGGWWAHDYHQWKYPAGEPGPGAVYEADFGYTATDAPCGGPYVHHEKIVSWAYVTAPNDTPSPAELKQAIYDRGPVAVAMCAGPALSGYTGGVFSTNEAYYCGGGSSAVNHGVVLVGWDECLGAWRMRNSWGSGWGESGYAYVAYGTSNIGYGASYVEYASVGPPAAPGNLRVVSKSQTQVGLAWDDGSSNESGFKIERSPNGSSACLGSDRHHGSRRHGLYRYQPGLGHDLLLSRARLQRQRRFSLQQRRRSDHARPIHRQDLFATPGKGRSGPALGPAGRGL